MTMNSSQKEKHWEALANQAVALAADISRDLDNENEPPSPSIRKARQLAVTNLGTMSKIVTLLLKKDRTAH